MFDPIFKKDLKEAIEMNVIVWTVTYSMAYIGLKLLMPLLMWISRYLSI